MRTVVAALGASLVLALVTAPPAEAASDVPIEVEGTVWSAVAEPVADGASTTLAQIVLADGTSVDVAAADLQTGATVRATVAVPAKIAAKVPGDKRGKLKAGSAVSSGLLAEAAGTALAVSDVEVLERPALKGGPTADALPDSYWTHEVYVAVAAPQGQSTNWLSKPNIWTHLNDLETNYREFVGSRFDLVWDEANFRTFNTSWSCNQPRIWNVWDEAVDLFGVTREFFSAGKHLIVFESVPLCEAAGVAIQGSDGVASYPLSGDISLGNSSMMEVRLGQPADLRSHLMAHEFGHTLGFTHDYRQECHQANTNLVTWDQDNSYGCREIEYGDNWDVMGIADRLSAVHKFQLGIIDYGDGLTEITQDGSGTVVLPVSPVSNNSGVQAVVFRPDANANDTLPGYSYFFEFRAQRWRTPLGVAVLRVGSAAVYSTSQMVIQPANEARYWSDRAETPVYLQPGDTFRSAGGHLTVTVQSLDEDAAVLAYTYHPTADVCRDDKATSCVFSNGTTGRIEYPYDVDWYKVTAPAGNWFIQAAVAPGLEGQPARAALYDQAGNWLDWASAWFVWGGGNETAAFVLQRPEGVVTGQQYTLAVLGNFLSGFDYTLSLGYDDCGQDLDLACALANGASGGIQYLFDEDFWAFTPPVTGEYTIKFRSSHLLYGYMEDLEWNYVGDLEDQGDGVYAITATLDSHSTYWVSVWADAYEYGFNYTVELIQPVLCTGTLSIQGTIRVGQPLSAAGLSCPASTFQYAWKRGDVIRSTTATFTPTAADLGSRITLTVTVSKSGATQVFTAQTPRQVRYFIDVPSTQRFYVAINDLVQRGIVSATSDNFWPDRDVTRAEMAAYLYRMAGRPAFTSPATPSFSDVPKTHMFYSDIEWLKASGITTGAGGGRYLPDQPATRGEIAAFLHRLDIYRNGFTPITVVAPSYTDVPRTHMFFSDIEWMRAQEVASAGTLYHPDRGCTRDEMAAFMYRYLGA
ncbi:MAG: S-layer homology domain-containing protein [Propionibacteriaceae bacterium]|jgi:hypothetical protein|nr:S-layer homology domain-containing protein [Propionibacteriaceae bacterium]